MIQCQNMLQTRSEHSTCHYDGNIYVFGGVDNADDELRSAERYDLSSNLWHALSPMDRILINGSAAEHQGKIYLRGSTNTSGEFLLYDPQINAFHTYTIFQKVAANFFMVHNHDSLYFIIGPGHFIEMDSNDYQLEHNTSKLSTGTVSFMTRIAASFAITAL